MLRITRIQVAGLVLALTLMAPSVAVAGSGTGACGGQPASAIDQYCEVIPGAGGGHGTGPGTRELASSLPTRTALRLLISHRYRSLLTIPAPARIHGARVTSPKTLQQAPGGGSAVDTSSVWWPMFLILAAIALGLVGVEIARRRRRGSLPLT